MGIHPARSESSSAAWENGALPSVLSPAFCQTFVQEVSLCSLAFAMSYLGILATLGPTCDLGKITILSSSRGET